MIDTGFIRKLGKDYRLAIPAEVLKEAKIEQMGWLKIFLDDEDRIVLDKVEKTFR